MISAGQSLVHGLETNAGRTGEERCEIRKQGVVRRDVSRVCKWSWEQFRSNRRVLRTVKEIPPSRLCKHSAGEILLVYVESFVMLVLSSGRCCRSLSIR
jgi:hypothetical protein